MKRMIKLLWVLPAIPIIISAVVYRSNLYPKGYYRNPLDIPVELAANFGEVRSGHFHMGLDIRTNGKENLPVYAAADGFISRVTIEEGSFGNAIYITHPNGTMSVYGHLNRFMPTLANYVHDKQYKDEQWEEDIHFSQAEFAVKQGMLVGYSGNTGASEGPHVHFEIRDTRTGNNLNPLLNGFGLNDNIPPVIHGLYWYDRTKSIYETEATPIAIRAGGNNYNTADKVITVTSPCISFGLYATDKNAETKYKLGIYKTMEYLDDSLVFSFALNSFCYNDTRYVNASIDYGKWFQQSKCIQLLCKLPGNRLPVFEGCPSNGVLHLEDEKIHRIKILVFDAAGNMAAIKLMVKYAGAGQEATNPTKHGQVILPGKSNLVKTANAEANFSRNAFYDTVPFTMYEEPPTEANAASTLIHLHNASVPVHDNYTIQIQTTLGINSPLRKHVVMQLTNDKHTVIVKGKWHGDMMEGSFTELGNIQLVIDTIAPDLLCKEGDNNHFTDNDKAVQIVYKDNFGDAAFFKGLLDGHWVLFEKKGDIFSYYFDEHCPAGKHSLLFTVVDMAGNATSKTFIFWKE